MNTTISFSFDGSEKDTATIVARLFAALDGVAVIKSVTDNSAKTTEAYMAAHTAKSADPAKKSAPRIRTAKQIAHDAEMKAKSALRQKLGMKGFGRDDAKTVAKFEAEWAKLQKNGGSETPAEAPVADKKPAKAPKTFSDKAPATKPDEPPAAKIGEVEKKEVAPVAPVTPTKRRANTPITK